METGINLQQILGVSKKNPYFTIWRPQDGSKELHVFFGSALMEVVKEDKTYPEFKLLIARLYNCGIKAKSITDVFSVARTTMKRWGRAIRCSDPEQIIRGLSGPGRPRKLTEEVISFSKLRFNEIYKQSHYGYSQQIRKEIKKVFKMEVSGESLRPLFKQLKETQSKCREDITEERKEEENRSETCECETEQCELMEGDSQPEPKEDGSISPTCDQVDGRVDKANRKKMITFHETNLTPVFCHHAGILLLSSHLSGLRHVTMNNAPFIQQVLLSILLGSKNIEQNKLFDFASLDAFLGETLRSIHLQRVNLSKLGAGFEQENLLAYNADLVHASTFTDFYMDPHTKHYTGVEKTLKSWCPKIRSVSKVMHMDFIHTSAGNPVYIHHADNFYDLRERLKDIMNGFRQSLSIPEEKCLTFIADRGIFKIDLFKEIYQGGNHIITWEKGYSKGQWDSARERGCFTLVRSRNYAEDYLLYTFRYMERPWKKDERMRQIIVLATNPKHRTTEVSILADDNERPAEEIIRLMFRRWIQENDFKYLDMHFGINEITSYAVIPYRKLARTTKDKQMKSGEYKALALKKRELSQKLSKRLLQEHKNTKTNSKRRKEIQALTSMLEDVENEMMETQKETSRLQTLIDQEYSQFDMNAKALMDTIKILARNIFYQAFKPFKQKYNNYRDDHVVFRNLTHSHGIMVFGKKLVEVILYPTMQHQPKLRRIIDSFLNELNNQHPLMPDGSGRVLHFSLGKKTKKLFAIQIDKKR